jgi:hypothetical protein
MTETVLGLTESIIVAACMLWACSLAFVRNRLGFTRSLLPKNQSVALRLFALITFGCAIKVSLAAPAVPALAVCIMLLSVNSVIFAVIFCFLEKNDNSKP